MEYAVFLQILLEFQLHTHEKYLYRFVKTFRQIDTEKRGYVNEVAQSLILETTDSTFQELQSCPIGEVPLGIRPLRDGASDIFLPRHVPLPGEGGREEPFAKNFGMNYNSYLLRYHYLLSLGLH